ncbi:hypothetical protein APHWI1_0062 [Anaplasma phagocytophilum str. ApWI1]|uniref:Uncharacterized protein n=2 Tax=Anaplasma phagocytophilum TaxID=948 RepID=A0A0F3PXZ0_ANAPH|nr:hypothetical protein APHWEB_1450 [Anaplasma phagocytophilum str. Webster]KJV65202.1 hypothetical protein EPHNCH_0887 [Anaplasma phagocytophilum str. NCH-1]KJV82454.1 hypothetical protein APHHGE2_0860 [Anaplasma phagocytophilum str. HGE2]KJV84726.1 hypothetical protein APHWI1_0077 [Anaplasma phagocytophilum str. ApWI1]KJV87704.1 hypothetical protein APHNYW_0605 [Anaplasma phagocytophilum str. ApNYW]KJZ99057.1 hypothetical protein APHCR_0089 [Anaplasma phagocytophilum str. CR1007]
MLTRDKVFHQDSIDKSLFRYVKSLRSDIIALLLPENL